jgi:putative endonuclease
VKHYVYILYSDKIDRYYIGKSSNPQSRLDHHNSNYNRIWTKRGKPWRILNRIEFENNTEASKAELFIKKQKSRKFIEKIIRDGWGG